MVNIPDKDPMGHGFGNSVMLQVAPFQAPAKHIHTLKTGCGLGRFRSRFQRWPTGRLSWQTVEVRSMGTYIHHHASNGINVWKHMWIHIYIYIIYCFEIYGKRKTLISLRVLKGNGPQPAKLPQHQISCPHCHQQKRFVVGSANIMGEFDHLSHDFTNVDFHENSRCISISQWQGTCLLGIEPYKEGFLSIHCHSFTTSY